MIIACPACSTRYVVPDSAVGAQGRTVRCAKCRHSWFQDGPEQPAAVQQAPPLAVAPPPAVETAAGPVPAPAPMPAFERPAAAAMPPPSPVDEPDTSPFDHAPPFRARRNPARMWTLAASLFALVAIGTIAATSWFGLPDWVPVARPTFGAQQPDLLLEFPGDQQDRRTLPSGVEFFGASGTITNTGRETRSIPPILIVLRDGQERIVYTWEVAPPQATLAPGETVAINEAVTDVPRSARVAEFGWKPD